MTVMTFEIMEHLLNFKLKLMDCNESIKTHIEFLNTADLYDEAINMIHDTLLQQLMHPNLKTISFLKEVVVLMEIVDKVFFNEMIALQELDLNGFTLEQKVEFIEGKLAADLVFKTDVNRNNYFRTVASVALNLGVASLIKKTLDKIQTLK